MSDVSTIPHFEYDEATPLPLIVAQKWGFPLKSMQHEGVLMYSVQDWMRGLSGEEDIRKIWSNFKKTEVGTQMSISNVRLPYLASDGKTYKRDYCNDKGLYIIAQYMRVTHNRPVLDAIRKFLAAAGAFVDHIRLEPDAVVESIANPEKLLDAFIEYYRKKGKDDKWIQARFESKIKRNQFTAALTEFVLDVLTPRHYATATDDVYKGLWGRSATKLKSQLELSKSANLRDHQPKLALHYQGIVEEVCAQKLADREELWWEEARDIIRSVAKIIGKQAQETSKLLNMDIATGKRLLPKS